MLPPLFITSSFTATTQPAGGAGFIAERGQAHQVKLVVFYIPFPSTQALFELQRLHNLLGWSTRFPPLWKINTSIKALWQ
ncbi:MAG TPA: hypothetical protein PLK74_05715 [Anaerolineaceae bacterium]|jgi:hypothetical protein|nr:hypothetical protein [Anaerolineaceae bacterium]HPD63823.1 hypothetical protein [Anaerolineaceae bacterium]HRS75505.1 hypothetical protein [Anaerolineaceae bacterium]HRT92656.1 hypothetical protein [Anaerolineaceae bacterium]